MNNEEACWQLMRACRTMKAEDEKFIAEACERLKGFSEDELAEECDILEGEAIRAHSIIWMCGEYFKSKGEDREMWKEDIIHAAIDFFEY